MLNPDFSRKYVETADDFGEMVNGNFTKPAVSRDARRIVEACKIWIAECIEKEDGVGNEILKHFTQNRKKQ